MRNHHNHNKLFRISDEVNDILLLTDIFQHKKPMFACLDLCVTTIAIDRF